MVGDDSNSGGKKSNKLNQNRVVVPYVEIPGILMIGALAMAISCHKGLDEGPEDECQ